MPGGGPDFARQSMTAMPYRDLVQIVTLAPDDTGYARSDGTSMVHLVRPDGFLAARGTPDRVDAIHHSLRALAPDASTAGPAGDSETGVRPDVSGGRRASSGELNVVRRTEQQT